MLGFVIFGGLTVFLFLGCFIDWEGVTFDTVLETIEYFPENVQRVFRWHKRQIKRRVEKWQ